MAAPGEHEPFDHGDVQHDPAELVKGVGKNARDVGVSTRHARGHDGGEEGEVDAPRVVPGRPTFPTGTERADDDNPAPYDDFAPREATPPTTLP